MAQIFRDTFTGPDGPLAGHSPEIGGAWTVVSGTWAIVSNALEISGGAPTQKKARNVFTSGDLGARLEFTLPSGAVPATGGLRLQRVDDNNYHGPPPVCTAK